MIDALIAGRLYGTPQRRTSKNGNAFVTAKVRTPMANGESTFINVVAFNDTAINAMLALGEGDSVAIAGELKVSVYQSADGTARPSLDLVAHAVLTEYHVIRKRRAIESAESVVAP
jgi:single-stranded DNA-binding protein